MQTITHPDESVTRLYEVGDTVRVLRTIHGGWFDHGPTTAEKCVIERIDRRSPRSIAKLYIRYSKEWGCAECFPWHVEPTEETWNSAKEARP